MYITPAQLADLPGALEISQGATTERTFGRPIDAALMEATLRGEDRAAYGSEDIAAADEALARVIAVIADADATIDGYLRLRGYQLPLDPVPPLVTTWARAIVRLRLHKDLKADDRSNPIARDYQDALKFLGHVASGKFSLGIGDPLADTVGTIQFAGDDRVFARGASKAWR